MSVSENMKALMDARGWTTEELVVASQKSGKPVTISAVNQWLLGIREPRGSNVAALAVAFGCSADDILFQPSAKALTAVVHS